MSCHERTLNDYGLMQEQDSKGHGMAVKEDSDKDLKDLDMATEAHHPTGQVIALGKDPEKDLDKVIPATGRDGGTNSVNIFWVGTFINLPLPLFLITDDAFLLGTAS